MKIFSRLTIIVVLYFLVLSCSDMNDKHDIYLAIGEKIYIGKVDSINVFPGNNRTKIRFWASDPRCKAVGFYWSPFNDSIIVDINKTSSTDSFELLIGGQESEKTIREGSYTLKILTFDKKGNRSIPFEKIIRIYGEKYQSSLSNRVLISNTYNSSNSSLLLNFGLPINTEDIGVRVSYTDDNGTPHQVSFDNTETSAPITITDIDKTKEVAYSTLYVPNPLAIDTFNTTSKAIVIK